MDLISILFTWLHLLAAVIRVGGIIFRLYIAIPSSRQALGPAAGKLMGEISKRFTPLANYSIVFLIVTGLVLTWFNKQFSGIGNFGTDWTLTLTLKHVLVLGMVIVHFYRGLVLSSKIVKTESIAEKASLQKLSLNLVKVNFCAGLLVLLLSGITSLL